MKKSKNLTILFLAGLIILLGNNNMDFADAITFDAPENLDSDDPLKSSNVMILLMVFGFFTALMILIGRSRNNSREAYDIR